MNHVICVPVYAGFLFELENLNWFYDLTQNPLSPSFAPTLCNRAVFSLRILNSTLVGVSRSRIKTKDNRFYSQRCRALDHPHRGIHANKISSVVYIFLNTTTCTSLFWRFWKNSSLMFFFVFLFWVCGPTDPIFFFSFRSWHPEVVVAGGSSGGAVPPPVCWVLQWFKYCWMESPFGLLIRVWSKSWPLGEILREG